MTESGSGYNPRYGRPRSRVGSRQDTRSTTRLHSNFRGHASRSLRGSPRLVRQNETSPIFSSPHGAQQPSFPSRVNPIISEVDSDTQSGPRELNSGAQIQLPWPDISLRSTPSTSLPSDVSLPPPWTLQGQTVDYAETSIQLQRADEVIMAIDIKESRLGCAFYTSAEDSLRLLHDAPFTEALQLIDFLMVHVEPTVVLLPLKVTDQVLHFFEEHKNTGDPGKERYILRTLGSNEFSHSASVDKLANLPIIGAGHAVVATAANRLPSDSTENESQNIKVMRLGSFIDLDCIISIGCAGAVLGEVIRMRSAQQILEVPERAPIAVLQMFALSDFMLITEDTLSSLQVFQSEIHPSTLISDAATSGSGSKESLSVYGLFRPLAGTPQGRTKLQQIFMRPLVNLQRINERHRTIEVLLRGGNAEALENLSRTLQEIKDVRKPLEQLQKGADAQTGAAIHRGVWWSLARFSVMLLRLRDNVLELQHADDLSTVQKVIDAIPVGVIKTVGARIESIVDFDEAKTSSRIAVKPNVSRELDDLKRKYHGLDSFLNEVRSSIYQTLPDWACPHVTGCVFWPQLGFFTIVSLTPNGVPAYKGQGSDDEDWEVVFITGGNAYCKNCRMVELDVQWGDPYSDIVDLEIQILHAFSCDILQHALALSRAADACGDLDCLVALARGAQKYGWAAPTMTEDNVIAIQGGRHPLQELAVPSFIANDCRLEGGSFDSVHRPETTALIVTGPNHSGKSVYIKQVALIVYLAHLGSFVPADLATIGITDQILTRISTKEGVSQNESAFGINLRQAAFLVRHSTRRSLVLIDEFGKGTSADDGAGLMAGLIDYFTTLGPEAPRTLITTHCHEIFEGDYLLERPGLSLAHMNVRLDLAAAVEDQVVFLYELLPGRSTSSFGSKCAALNGVSDAVVERAEAIILLLARNEDIGAACAKLGDEDRVRLQKAERVARSFVELDLEDHGLFTRETLGRFLV